MNPFILNRTDERTTKSAGRIALYAWLFFVVTRIAMVVVLAVVTKFYRAEGIDPQEALQFLGNPHVIAGKMGWWALPYILFFAPLFEECAFRLGLSFRKWHVTLGLGMLVAFFVSRAISLAGGTYGYLWALPVGFIFAGSLCYTTTDAFWNSKREKWLRPMMWTSAILFGLVHLFSMQGLTPMLLPYALLMCLMSALAGAVFAYLRVNLGFCWAVGAHMLSNLLSVYLIISILMRQ